MSSKPPNEGREGPGDPNHAASQVVHGTPMGEDDVAIMKRFRDSFFPDATIKDQDTYAKWLFGLTTTIAALGTGFSHAAFATLSRLGDFFYACAVLSAGAGLACALWALSEEVKTANWADFNMMTVALSELVKRKKKILMAATLFLFLSFVAAAAAPLASTIDLWPSNHPSGMTVRISDRALEAGISLSGMSPGAKAMIEVETEVEGKTGLVAAFHQVVDKTGVIDAKLPEIKLTPEAQNLKIVLTYERDGLPVREEDDFSVPAAPCPKDSATTCKNPCKTSPPKHGSGPQKPPSAAHQACPTS